MAWLRDVVTADGALLHVYLATARHESRCRVTPPFNLLCSTMIKAVR